MSKKPTLGAGNVEIELAGETVVLRPTLKAAQSASRQFGGIMGAIDRLVRCELDVLTGVIALGLDKPAKEVADAVWRTGATDLAPKAIEYLSILANGGRPPNDDGGEEPADPPSGE